MAARPASDVSGTCDAPRRRDSSPETPSILGPIPALPTGAGGPRERAAGRVSGTSAQVLDADPLLRLHAVAAVRALGFGVADEDGGGQVLPQPPAAVFLGLHALDGCPRLRPHPGGLCAAAHARAFSGARPAPRPARRLRRRATPCARGAPRPRLLRPAHASGGRGRRGASRLRRDRSAAGRHRLHRPRGRRALACAGRPHHPGHGRPARYLAGHCPCALPRRAAQDWRRRPAGAARPRPRRPSASRAAARPCRRPRTDPRITRVACEVCRGIGHGMLVPAWRYCANQLAAAGTGLAAITPISSTGGT